MTWRCWAAASAPWLLSSLGCKTHPASVGQGPDAAEEAAAVPFGGMAPPRCRPGDRVLPLGVAGDVEIGGAVESQRGVGVGLVHQAAMGAVAAVALLPPDAADLRVVDLGPTPADAPPPRLAWRGPDAEGLLAIAASAPRDGGTSPGMAVHLVGTDGSSKLLLVLADVQEDWSSADVAASGDRGLVVWEGSALAPHSPPRGAIRAIPLHGEERQGAPRELSAPGLDAENPRVIGGRSRFFVLWAAKPLEDTGVHDGAASLEVAMERRGPRWLEAVVLDDHGAPMGPVRRLTSATQHVASYDARVERSDGGPGSLLLVARVEGGSSEGSALERLRVLADGTSETPSEIPTGGLGSGAPTLMVGASSWLAWASAREETVLLPLDAAGRPSGQASSEDGFEASQPLVALGGPNILAARLASSSGPAELRVFACSR